MRLLIFLNTLVFLVRADSVIAQDSIPLNRNFVSPNGRYSIHLSERDATQYFIIKDNETGQVDDSICMPTVLLLLCWAADSHAVITIEHIAGGSFARILFQHDKSWTAREYEPPGESRMNFSVTKLTMKSNQIYIKYVIRTLRDNGYPSGYQIYAFDVNLNTGERINEKWSSITEADFLREVGKNPHCP